MEDEEEDNKADSTGFVQAKWNKQYLNYYQVLDMDPESYMVLYNCIETKGFRVKETKQVLTEKEAWEHVINKDLQVDLKSPEKAAYEFDETVEAIPLYKQKVSILWRPSERKLDEDKTVMVYNADHID